MMERDERCVRRDANPALGRPWALLGLTDAIEQQPHDREADHQRCGQRSHTLKEEHGPSPKVLRERRYEGVLCDTTPPPLNLGRVKQG